MGASKPALLRAATGKNAGDEQALGIPLQFSFSSFQKVHAFTVLVQTTAEQSWEQQQCSLMCVQICI